MLLPRVLSALVGIPIALLLVCGGGWWVTVPLVAIAAIAIGEFCGKAAVKGIAVVRPAAYGVGLGLLLATHAYACPGPLALSPERYGRALLALSYLLVMGTLAAAVVRYHRNQETPVTAEAGATVFVALYVGATFSFFVLLRAFGAGESAAAPASFGHPLPLGARLLILVLFATWATDSGAYFVGKGLGKRKLTPASPNKTVEGCVGGVAGGLSVGLVGALLLGVGVGLGLGIGLICGVAGQVGDLAKSILKRDLGTKDFGELIPGHGGILDRLDSLMMNVPLVYGLVALVR